MSSRFVSAGAINPTTGEVASPAPFPASTSISPPTASETTAASSVVPPTSSKPTTTVPAPAPPSNPDPPAPAPAPAPSKKSQEWLTVQAELEAAKQQRSSLQPSTIGGPAAPQEQKSLYEVLQANKAAKQAAFEEANKIKNQFRALDDDEIEFLESVAERKRREEEERRREEEGGLRKFREMQRRKGSGEDEGDGDGSDEDQMGEEGFMFLSGTGNGRKRRRGGEGKRLVPGVKRVKSQGNAEDKGEMKEEEEGKAKTVATDPVAVMATAATTATMPVATAAAPVKKPLGGLVSYGSSDEDDD